MTPLDKILMEDSKEFETLPDDKQRCNGYLIMNGSEMESHSDCVKCLRRTTPRPNLTWMINPPISFPCPYRLASRNL
jgi:hypothetical protein